jgi:hypothetical protein
LTAYPPSYLLPVLAKALKVTADQLLGLEEVKGKGTTHDNRLWRRFSGAPQICPALAGNYDNATSRLQPVGDFGPGGETPAAEA